MIRHLGHLEHTDPMELIEWGARIRWMIRRFVEARKYVDKADAHVWEARFLDWWDGDLSDEQMEARGYFTRVGGQRSSEDEW